MDETLWDLSESYSFDPRPVRHDIEGSKAHVSGLATAGLLSADEATTLLATLDAIREEFASGEFERAASDEDIHMAIETPRERNSRASWGRSCTPPVVVTTKWRRRCACFTP